VSEKTQDATLATSLMIAEFSHLRQEQFHRTSTQQLLTNLNLTFAATISGFVLTRTTATASSSSANQQRSVLLLLLIPIISFILGLQYYHQDRSIIRIGNYIDQVLRPFAMRISGETIFQWEPYLRRRPGGRELTFLISADVLGVFVGVGMGGLGFSSIAIFGKLHLTHLQMVSVRVIWISELFLLMLLGVLWVRAARRGFPRPYIELPQELLPPHSLPRRLTKA
jgi:hypothetical protein